MDGGANSQCCWDVLRCADKTPEALVAVVVVMVLWARGFSETVVVLFVGMINQATLIVPHPPLPPQNSDVLSPYHTTCSG